MQDPPDVSPPPPPPTPAVRAPETAPQLINLQTPPGPGGLSPRAQGLAETASPPCWLNKAFFGFTGGRNVQLLAHLQPERPSCAHGGGRRALSPRCPHRVPLRVNTPLGRRRGASHPRESGNQLRGEGGAVLERGAGGEQDCGGWEDGKGLLKGSGRSQEHIFQPGSESAPASSVPRKEGLSEFPPPRRWAADVLGVSPAHGTVTS